MRKLALLLIILALGCAGTARVRTGAPQPPKDKKTLPGIPFFPKSAACKQETVWLEPVYVITRENLDSTGTKPSGTQVKIARRSDLKDNSGVELGKLRLLQDQFNVLAKTGTLTSDDFEAAWKAITATGSISINPPSGNQSDTVLAANSSTAETFVDYSRPYYFNTRMPWIGNSTANATVAADGSITNITASADNQTVKAILDLLPVNALLTARLGLAPPAAGVTEAAVSIEALDGSTSAPPQRVTLRVETQLFQHTLIARTTPAVSPCPVKTPIEFNASNIQSNEYQWQALVVGKAEKKVEEKKPDDKKPDEKKPEGGSIK